jgi:putative DNA methylase
MSEAAAISKSAASVAPFSLKDKSSLIEVQLPVNRISAEAYKERTAGSGQTLTALGSYWKGRKPLVLVRAVALASLLPSSGNSVRDLEVFLKLMGMHDDSFIHRIKSISPDDISPDWSGYRRLIDEGTGRFNGDLDEEERTELISEFLQTLPYDDRLKFCLRPEECDGREHSGIWDEVNSHLKTSAKSLAELVEQLGFMRFGRRPKLADTFAGGGSIPFEAARIGFDVTASDLNPVACMLSWGAVNVIGASRKERETIDTAIETTAEKVNEKIADLGFETDKNGNRAKTFLYCLEVTCPKTGWVVPLAPSWVISKKRSVCAKLVPIPEKKRYDFEIVENASAKVMAEAAKGTYRNGRVVHPANPDSEGVAITVVRGDFNDGAGDSGNKLRPWTKSDIRFRHDDIYRERLWCVQWLDGEDIARGKARPRTWFSPATEADLERETAVADYVEKHLADWQKRGVVPDMEIETGLETARLKRERGWTHWHHLFGPRNLLVLATINENFPDIPFKALHLAHQANWNSKLCLWFRGFDTVNHTFDNQALNVHYDWGCRSSYVYAYLLKSRDKIVKVQGNAKIINRPANEVSEENDIFVTDPPYADAVNYHEITEFFISWLRGNPPPEFRKWKWDSRRALAIQGTDEHFRREMVGAYKAMADHMSDNGLQVVMFTHQDAGVWADLAAIMWAAGLRVTAAWNIVTETESALKQGNYVQGTILLVLRKRGGDGNVKKMDIEMEVEDEVRDQLDRMHAIDDDWTGERLYTDGDYQLAAYAAALRVITSYKTIDRRDVGADVYRKLGRGERTVIRELIDYAASVANNMLVPDGCNQNLWRDLDPASRFYFRMLEMESKGGVKFADFQNFAKTFALDDYTSLMSNTTANKASLAGAIDLKGRMLGDEGFGSSPLRLALFAVWKTHQKDGDPKEGVTYLRTELGPDYWATKAKLIEIAEYLRDKNRAIRPEESEAAGLLVEALKMDRL